MKNATRIRVAAVVGAVALNKKVTSVFDFSDGTYKNVSADISNGRVNGYDYTTTSFFNGANNGNLDFYDYQNSSHVQLKIGDLKFKGYDFDTKTHFSGTIKQKTVSVFDFESSQYYNYSV